MCVGRARIERGPTIAVGAKAGRDALSAIEDPQILHEIAGGSGPRRESETALCGAYWLAAATVGKTRAQLINMLFGIPRCRTTVILHDADFRRRGADFSRPGSGFKAARARRPANRRSPVRR